MGRIEVGRARAACLAMSTGLLLLVGCATVQDTQGWPEVDIERSAPTETHEGPATLIRGEDGLVYAVGEFESAPRAGQIVFGRYGGSWPLQETARPALFAGTVVEVLSEQLALVHPFYQFPDSSIDNLKVEFADSMGEETMGKGVGVIQETDFSGPSHLTISLGHEVGTQRGDIYAILKDFDGTRPREAQLTRRILGVCMVVEFEAEQSQCRLWQGHPEHQWAGRIEAGQKVVFLEPTFAKAPPQATIYVNRVEDEAVNEWVKEQLEAYLSRFPNGNVAVEFVDYEVDARDANFYRWHRRIDTDHAALLLGVNVIEKNGQDHLILNYTGLGPAVGPGMVAAPPESGVDMGRVDRVSSDDWRGVASVLMGTVMVYRGQTSLALMHLNEALRDPALTGKWRWHARDQYAMRWGALNRYEEAMWLIHEDEAVARRRDDDQAYYNALGTRVRLHDFLDQPERAHQTAQKYLAGREGDKPESGYLAALAMYAEMAAQNDDLEGARRAVVELEELCPDGCEGDLLGLLAGVFWASFGEDPRFQDELVERMVAAAQTGENVTGSLASARVFQGWNFLMKGDLEQSLVAFLEAQRLYERDNSSYGVARTQFYLALTQIARQEPQAALDYAQRSLDYMTEVGDYGSTVRIYERLSQLFSDLEVNARSRGVLASATRILPAYVQVQLSTGNYSKAAEASFAYGHFLYRFGQGAEASTAFQRAVIYGIRSASFDTVAMSHLFLALQARADGDRNLYEAELRRARMMAEIAEDPMIEELIESVVSPRQEAEDPTQLL